MALYPGAIWKPITADKGRRPMAAYNRVNLHVAVSEAASLHGAFNKSGVPDSHFYVRRDGTVEQYVDTSMRAFADLDGNDATISVETQGGVRNPDTEPWTDAQLDALAEIYAWAVKAHRVPRQVAWNSIPGPSSHGLSWHRLGIDGNFPLLPDVRAGRTQRGGGMRYSKSRGKLCPGGTKVQQVPTIHSRALAILGAQPHLPVTPKPAPIPVPEIQEDDMRGLVEACYRRFYGRDGSVKEVDTWTIDFALAKKTPAQIAETFLSSRPEPGSVVATYREFLTRDPAPSEVTSWLKAGTVRDLRAGIANSPEAKSKKG